MSNVGCFLCLKQGFLTNLWSTVHSSSFLFLLQLNLQFLHHRTDTTERHGKQCETDSEELLLQYTMPRYSLWKIRAVNQNSAVKENQPFNNSKICCCTSVKLTVWGCDLVGGWSKQLDLWLNTVRILMRVIAPWWEKAVKQCCVRCERRLRLSL